MTLLTYTESAKLCRALGFTFKRTDGEIRVSWPMNESAAYYTDCPDDAYWTAVKMAKEQAPKSDMVKADNGTECEIETLYVIGTVNGVTFYECPIHGDECPLQIITDNTLTATDWYELPTSEEME